MKQFVLILASLSLILAASFHAPLSHNRFHPRTIQHSKAFDNYHENSFHHLRLNHQRQFQVSKLHSTLVGFRLELEVAGYKYKLSMDTGSSDIWIKGQNATGDPKERYRCGDFCVNTHVKYPIGYLDGFLSTYGQTLQVKFNGHVFDCPLLVAYKGDSYFDTNEGILGLSYESLATHKPTFIQTLINEKIIDKYAYGMNLNIIEPNRAFITFGDQDPSFYQGELYFYDIPNNYQVRIDFNWMKVADGKEIRLSSALLDTGNTCITIPKMFEQAFIEKFNSTSNKCFFDQEPKAQSFSLLRCRVGNFDELPQVTLNIQGNQYKIEKEYYLQGCAERDGEYFCDTYFESRDSWGSYVFLGDGFFNSFYVFFNLEENKVGIAKNKEHLTIHKVLTLNSLELDDRDWKEWDNLV